MRSMRLAHAQLISSVLLLAAVLQPASAKIFIEAKWRLSHESLSDYAAVSSLSAETRIKCTAAASRDSSVQLVIFNASSGLCTHFKCRLGLSHCRKCRSVNQGAQQVWTASSECWTTVQHRVSVSVDFYRNWTQYRSEFGEGPDGNYWIGLESLYTLTSFKPRKLRVLMKLWNDTESWAEYSSFAVGSESTNYTLSVSGFSASPEIGDSMSNGNGMQFSTMDADHDAFPAGSCAIVYAGAWWFNYCMNAHPNGQYKDLASAIGGAYAQGIVWYTPYGFFYSLKEIEMLVI